MNTVTPQPASELEEKIAAAIPGRYHGTLQGDGWTIRRARPGEQWFPWNYGQKREFGGTVRKRIYEPDYGRFVFNAYSPRGALIGSTEVTIGDRGSIHVAANEEAHGGFLQEPWFWPAHPAIPWVLVGRGTYVKPAWRRKGVARALVEVTKAIGLPAYMVFATDLTREWFNRRYTPDGERSWLQQQIEQLATPTGSLDPRASRCDFTVTLAMTGSRVALHDLSYECPDRDEPWGLDDWLVEPYRPTPFEIDGEMGVPAFTDSAFARDRAYGYTFTNWLISNDPPIEYDDAWTDEEYAQARERFERIPAAADGSIEVEVLDPKIMRTYASIRRFLRTLEWSSFSDDEVPWELFVNDLAEAPRGLKSFAAVIVDQAEHDE